MYTTSEDFKTIINNPSRKFECKVMCGSKTYTNVNIVSISITGSLQPSGYTIGSAISHKATFKFINDGNVTFPSNTIELHIGLLVNGAYEYIPIGKYTIDSHDSDDYTITIVAYDNMMKFESKYNGTGTTLRAIAQEICSSCGVTLGSTIPTTTVTTPTSGKYTNREIIGYIAGCMCGNAVIDRVGQLKIQKLNLSTIDKEVTTDNWFTYKNADMIFSIEKLICDTGSGKIESGSSTDEVKTLTIKNALMTQSILDSVKTELSNINFTGFNVKYQGDISTDLGDTVKVIDRKGQTLTAPLLQKTINYNGGLTEDIKTEGKKKVDVASSYYANGRYSLDFDKYNYKFDEYDANFNDIDIQINSLDSRVTDLEKGSGSTTTDESIYIIDTSYSTNKTIKFSNNDTDYTTDWGDGTIDKKGSHTYTTDGKYTIKTQQNCCMSNYGGAMSDLIEIVKIAENITIGDSAFKNFYNLYKVGDILGIKDGYEMFRGCTKLQHPANVRDLVCANYMYYDCDEIIDTGRFPETLKEANYMFGHTYSRIDRTKLKYVEQLNEGLEQASHMFENRQKINYLYNLPSSLKFADYMFYNCTSLDRNGGILIIPKNLINADYMFNAANVNAIIDFSQNSVLEKAKNMFYNSGIISVNQIPLSITNMDYMFYGCQKATFTISELPKIKSFEWSFTGCKSLKNAIAIPDTAKSVYEMYSGCSSLATAVKIPDGVTNCSYVYNGCESLVDVDINILPNNPSEKVNAECAFSGCINLIVAPNIYANIENADEMFMNCSKLEKMANMEEGVVRAISLYNSTSIKDCNQIILPNSLKYMSSMFYMTPVTTTINIVPESCTSVSSMYYGCSLLTTITGNFISAMNNSNISHDRAFTKCYALTTPYTYNDLPSGWK